MVKAIQAIEQDREKVYYEARLAAEENFDLFKMVDALEDIFQQAMYPQKNE
jgi:hypothetical protein